MTVTTNERLVRHDRLVLGTLCGYFHPASSTDAARVVTVIGTWDWDHNAVGHPRDLTRKQARQGQDPRTDESARGYLLMPSDGSPWIFAFFGAVAEGDLKPLFPALRLVK